ncbi:unnamed protein product [Amoebophrya sp. A25]|nr:unnamed protein product [Amoebophrya sp. A25]|eukprot:GSA25T00014921001.1
MLRMQGVNVLLAPEETEDFTNPDPDNRNPIPPRDQELYPVTAGRSLSPLSSAMLQRLLTTPMSVLLPFPVNLNSLSLRGTKLFAVPHESFFESIERLPLLRDLDLADTKLGYLKHAHDGAGLTKVIRESLMKLEKLDLSHNLLQTDLHEFGDALRRNEFESLIELRVSHIPCIDIDSLGIPYVLECLRENTKLRMLDVSHCECTPKTMFILEQTLLSKKTNISEVDACGNPIGVAGIEAMNRALCFAEMGDEKLEVSTELSVDYTDVRLPAFSKAESLEDRNMFKQPFDVLTNAGFTCISESPSYNNLDPSRSTYTLHLTRSSYDRCLLRALLYRDCSAYKMGKIKFLPGGNCKDFNNVFSNFSSLPPAKARRLKGSAVCMRPLYLDNTLELHEEFFEDVVQPPMPDPKVVLESPSRSGSKSPSSSPRSPNDKKKRKRGKKAKFVICKFSYSETEHMIDVINPQTKKPRQNHEVLKYFLEKNKTYAPLSKFISIAQILKKFVKARPVARQMFLASLSKEFIFSISQLRYIIGACPAWERAQVVSDIAGAVKIDDTLSSAMQAFAHAKLYNFIKVEKQRLQLKSTFVNFLRFNSFNPSGRYILNFGKNGDVQVFQRLVIIAAWQKKILLSHNCPDFAQHGDLQLMRNVFLDGREHVVTGSGSILVNKKSKVQLSVGALIASAGGGDGDGDGLSVELDYYSPIHPHPKERTKVHAAAMDSICYMLESEKYLPNGVGDFSEILGPDDTFYRDLSKEADGEEENEGEEEQDALISPIESKSRSIAGSPNSTIKGINASGQQKSSSTNASTKVGGAGARTTTNESGGSSPAKQVALKHANTTPAIVEQDKQQGRSNSKTAFAKQRAKTAAVDTIPEKKTHGVPIPVASRALALTAVSDKLVLSYEDFVRILLVFKPEKPKDLSHYFGENLNVEDLITRLTGGFTTAEDGIGRILEDRVAAHGLTQWHSRCDVFVRLFSRCTELERVCSVECLYSTLLFDVFAMYQISFRLGRLICHDWVNLDNRYAKSKIENPAEAEKHAKATQPIPFTQDNYLQVCERLGYLRDRVDISNFQSTFHLFDLELAEDWRCFMEMLKLGDNETTAYQTVILQDMKWSGGHDREDAMYNPPRGWYMGGPPKTGFASLKYFIPWGVVRKIETYKKRRGVGMRLTNRQMYMELTDENLPALGAGRLG